MENQVSQTTAFAVIGQQQLELVVLRERLAILQSHRCEPCREQCCTQENTEEESA